MSMNALFRTVTKNLALMIDSLIKRCTVCVGEITWMATAQDGNKKWRRTTVFNH
jgi:hypothetical protein